MKRSTIFGLALCLAGAAGCARLVYVSKPGDHRQVYEMKESGASQANISNNAYAEEYPDVSPDGKRVVLASGRGGQHLIVTRSIGDTSGAGSTEKTLAGGAGVKTRPRWSCQQDMVAYADLGTDNQARIFIARMDGDGNPVGAAVQVTAPGNGESDSGGHDFLANGNRIVFSRRSSGTNSYDLYSANSDGTGDPVPVRVSQNVNETLPVVSHDGQWLAYREYVLLAPGNIERIVVLRTGTWAPYRILGVLPPARTGTVAALGFSGDDGKLFYAAEAIEPAGPGGADRLEIFSIDIGADNTQKRLTSNQVTDTHPDGVPCGKRLCTRCAEVGRLPSVGPSPQVLSNGVVVRAAVLPDGNPSTVSVEDYSAPRDGVNEIKIGWSQAGAGNARYASILFPPEAFGDGPSEVLVTAFHFNACRLAAYDKNGNMVASAAHTAGQRTSQTLTLRGGKISRIDVIGAEIGIQEICYRR